MNSDRCISREAKCSGIFAKSKNQNQGHLSCLRPILMKVPHIRLTLFLHLARRRIKLVPSPCSFTTWFALKPFTREAGFLSVEFLPTTSHWSPQKSTACQSCSPQVKAPPSQLSFSQLCLIDHPKKAPHIIQWITFLFSTSEKWKPPLSQLSFSQRGKGLALVSQGTGAGLSSYQPLPHLRRAAMHYRHHSTFLILNCGSGFCLMSQAAFFLQSFRNGVGSIGTSWKWDSVEDT